nr:hypothetical protein [Tanacetum cinerariifolium]
DFKDVSLIDGYNLPMLIELTEAGVGLLAKCLAHLSIVVGVLFRGGPRILSHHELQGLILLLLITVNSLFAPKSEAPQILEQLDSSSQKELQGLILLLLITVNSLFGPESEAHQILAPMDSSSQKVSQSLLRLHSDERPVESRVGPVATLMRMVIVSRQDFYDVSLDDGYNLPMLIEPTGR